ncbi:MAG: IS4 family transposase [Flavobacteriaceae bacterium]|nr:IS4 family transposase [Flavobacteriaceae bacterium]
MIFTGYIWGKCNSLIREKKDYRIGLTKHIDYELSKEEFLSRSKDGSKGVFTRDRKLPIRKLIIIIMSLNRAIQRELDSFFKKLDSSDYTIREATKGAFSQARSKLNEWGFKRLNEVAVDTFYERAEYYTWNFFRLLAVDGTRIMLPNHHTIKEEFGECSFGPNADSKRSMAIGSMLYDVLNQITIDAQLSPYKNTNNKRGSERALLEKHMPKLKQGDLLLLDRGYSSFALFFLLKAQNIEFCVRMKGSWWKEVRKFRESGEKERIVTFTLPDKDQKKLSQYPKSASKPIKCRLIRVELDKGEILCTSLIDTKQYPHEQFKELYHFRWNEEEAYKLLKNRIELEDFSGKTAKAVKQDFHAKIFLLTLSAAYAHPIEERVKKEFKADQNRKYNQKINRTNAISMTKEILIGVFIKQQYENALKAFDDIVYNTREIIRPGRKNERKHRQKKRYSMNYKRL